MIAKLLVAAGAVLLGAALIPATIWIGDRVFVEETVNRYNQWRWSEQEAGIDYCANRYKPHLEVIAGQTPENLDEDRFWIEICIRPESKTVYRYEAGHQGTVFTCHQQTLYVAEFARGASGCEVVAVDLATGNECWRTPLQGLGPVDHSKYSNRINIDNDGQRIIVYGNESGGRYVETLDIKTGKTLLNVAFDLDR